MSGSPGGWVVARLRIGDPEARSSFAGILAEVLDCAVQEDGEDVLVYLDERAAGQAIERIRREAEGTGIDPEGLRSEWREAEDWAARWKEGLAPRRVGRRFIVTPTWMDPEADPDDLVVTIDPQMAFGTGEHATTRGCLRLLENRVRSGARVLDIGSGSGVLSIAAVRLGARRVTAVEVDPDANLNARDNLERNGVAERVHLIEAAADAALLGELGAFDVVVANILSSVIRPLLPAMTRAMAPEGAMVLSGILDVEAAAVVAHGRTLGLALTAEDREGEWWSGVLERAGPSGGPDRQTR